MENSKEIKKMAYDLGLFYERTYGCCSQCVLAAIKNTLGNIPDDVFKSSTGLGAGIAGAGYACGALTGGVMALSMFVGRTYDNFPDPDGIRFKTFELSRKLAEKFEAEYGGGNCSDVQKAIMGRSYDIMRGERDIFIEHGGHDDKCPIVCGKAAEWTVELLEEAGLI